jgi:hypothetical protein
VVDAEILLDASPSADTSDFEFLIFLSRSGAIGLSREMVAPLSLRRHYPDQVQRVDDSKPSSQPGLPQLPVEIDGDRSII